MPKAGPNAECGTNLARRVVLGTTSPSKGEELQSQINRALQGNREGTVPHRVVAEAEPVLSRTGR